MDDQATLHILGAELIAFGDEIVRYLETLDVALSRPPVPAERRLEA